MTAPKTCEPPLIHIAGRRLVISQGGNICLEQADDASDIIARTSVPSAARVASPSPKHIILLPYTRAKMTRMSLPPQAGTRDKDVQ